MLKVKQAQILIKQTHIYLVVALWKPSSSSSGVNDIISNYCE